MSWENTLLLFEDGYPCWTSDTVELAGEDPGELKVLENMGLLEKTGTSIFQLTEEGRTKFRIQSEEYFFDALPAEKSPDPQLDLKRLQLKQLLDSSFLGRWGLKKFEPGKKVYYYPALPPVRTFITQDNGPEWTYPETHEIRTINSQFPLPRVPDPDMTPEDISRWMVANGIHQDHFQADLLLRHYCDFEYYMHVLPPATDTEKFLHCDRFFFHFARDSYFKDPSSIYEYLGKFHLLLFYYRHLGLPGSFDLDIHQQENISVLIFVTETEDQAEDFYDRYHGMGEKLMGPGRPMEIEALSIEALKGHSQREDSHFDLFDKLAHRVAITYPPDS